MELPTCREGTCPGHRADDLLPQGDFLDDGARYSNEEFYAFIHPYSEALPYVYNSLDTWPSCEAQGIDFLTYPSAAPTAVTPKPTQKPSHPAPTLRPTQSPAAVKAKAMESSESAEPAAGAASASSGSASAAAVKAKKEAASSP